MTFVPRGAKGALLKSKLPKIWLYTDSFEFKQKGRNIVRVATACGVSQHHRWGGKRSSVPFKMEMKWLLNVLLLFQQGCVDDCERWLAGIGVVWTQWMLHEFLGSFVVV